MHDHGEWNIGKDHAIFLAVWYQDNFITMLAVMEWFLYEICVNNAWILLVSLRKKYSVKKIICVNAKVL